MHKYERSRRNPQAVDIERPCHVGALMLEHYVHPTIDGKSELRGLVNTKKGMTLRKNGAISYTRISELVKGKLSSLGCDNKQFSLHSFTAGGATAAVNAQVKDRLLGMADGNWKPLKLAT